jgi:hypothetical protein
LQDIVYLVNFIYTNPVKEHVEARWIRE